MAREPLDLRPFRHRVRLVRAWRGFAVGLFVGGVVGTVWAVLDLFGVLFSEWSWLGAVFGGCALLGAAVGALIPVRDKDVAVSIDRRARLRDRLNTFFERKDESESFDEPLKRDARDHVSALRASRVFPVRFGKWQTIGVAAVVLASLAFLLGNTWYVLSPDARKAKEDLEKIAAQIERVAKPLRDDRATAEEKSFANQLDAFAKKLEKGRISKEEAMQRANDLAKQAEKLTQKRTDQAFQNMQSVRQQMTRQMLGEKGLDRQDLEKLNLDQKQRQLLDQLERELNMDSSQSDEKFSQGTMEQLGMQGTDRTLLNLTKDQRDALKQLLQKKLSEIDSKLANSQNLTPDEIKNLLDQKQQLQKAQQQLQISEEARKALEEFMNSPEFKDIMKAVQQMRGAAQQVNDGNPLTSEQIKELEKMIEDLAKKLKDSKYRDMVLEQLKNALEMLKAGKATCEAGGT